jgi:hypothetical protein
MPQLESEAFSAFFSGFGGMAAARADGLPAAGRS